MCIGVIIIGEIVVHAVGNTGAVGCAKGSLLNGPDCSVCDAVRNAIGNVLTYVALLQRRREVSLPWQHEVLAWHEGSIREVHKVDRAGVALDMHLDRMAGVREGEFGVDAKTRKH